MSMPARLMRPHITLDQLLHGLAAAPAIQIQGISSDSRRLCAGDLFVALEGDRSHGLDYLEQAIDTGVAAIVWEPDSAPVDVERIEIPMIPVPGLSLHVGTIANRWFGKPSAAVNVVGVTGTNGKTTVAFVLTQCLQLLGRQAAYIGTLGAGMDDLAMTDGMTTPACIDLHRMLAEFHDAGATDVALEVSSHGIRQNRINGVQFDGAIFTNLSRDHLDYHGDMGAYGATKARFFLEHDITHRIINIDGDFGERLAAQCPGEVTVVSTHRPAAAGTRPGVFVRECTPAEQGFTVTIDSAWGSAELRLPLYGDFNVANAVAVLAFLLTRGFPLEEACAAIGGVSAPPGRMQRVSHEALPQVFVDYAHTPAGLEAALLALRPHCSGRLWCVFGCGGERDPGKRPLMGRIAERLADLNIVTNDNPRREAPAQIVDQIIAGMSISPVVIEDRAAAIAYAIAAADDDDVILLAGKGHEPYQHIGTERRPFSDYGIALANLSARQVRDTGRT